MTVSHSNSVKSLQRRLSNWFESNEIFHPWRISWRETRDPFPIWVSEIMLQQTTIQVVAPAFSRFIRAIPSVRILASVSDDELKPLVAGLGYYRRFMWLRSGSQQLVEKSKENEPVNWPSNAAEWQKIKGVGPYTSAAISSITNQEKIGVVDGNVERVVSRFLALDFSTGDSELKSYSQAWMNELVQTEQPGQINEAVMELGQLVCRPQNPRCDACPIQTFCQAFKKNLVGLLPKPKKKKKLIPISLALVCPISLKGNFQLNRREEGARFLKNHLGFYTYLQSSDQQWTPDGHSKPFPRDFAQIGRFRHAITKYKIEVSVFSTQSFSENRPTLPDFKTLSSQLSSNLDRKALRILSHSPEKPIF